MAMTGVLRPGFIQLRVLDMARSIEHYRDHLGLELVSKQEDGRVYFKAWDEFDRHSVILRQAPEAGMDFMSFKVATDGDLDSFAKRVEEWGLTVDRVAAGEQPGVGRRVGFVIPSGHRIELYAEMDMAQNRPETHNPNIWRDEPRAMGVIRFDHALLYGPNIAQVSDFFVQALDFKLAERVTSPDEVLAIWLTCSTKAHDIAFVKHDTPDKLHHAAFLLQDWQEVGHAADLMVRHDISIDIGPTRHGITRGQTIYFFDPSGNRNEVFAGGYTYYPDNPTRSWDANNLGKAIFYYERALNERFLTVVT